MFGTADSHAFPQPGDEDSRQERADSDPSVVPSTSEIASIFGGASRDAETDGADLHSASSPETTGGADVSTVASAAPDLVHAAFGSEAVAAAAFEPEPVVGLGFELEPVVGLGFESEPVAAAAFEPEPVAVPAFESVPDSRRGFRALLSTKELTFGGIAAVLVAAGVAVGVGMLATSSKPAERHLAGLGVESTSPSLKADPLTPPQPPAHKPSGSTSVGGGAAQNVAGSGGAGTSQQGLTSSTNLSVPSSSPGQRFSVAVNGSSFAGAFALSGSGTVIYATQSSRTNLSSYTGVPGGPTNAASAPAAVTNADGHLEVFVRTAGGQIADGWQTSGGWHWDSAVSGGALPGTPVGDPDAVKLADGRVALFTRLYGGAVAETAQTQPNGTQGWAGWTSLGGSLAGNPVPFMDADGNLDVFGISTSGTLVLDTWNGSRWSGWNTVGSSPGGLADDPAPVADASTGTEVFVTTASGSVDHVWITSSGWVWGVPLAPDTLGAGLVGTVGAMRWSDGHVEVFARLADGRLAHAWQNSPNGSKGWSGWGVLPGYPISAPTAYLNPGGTPEVVALGSSTTAGFSYWTGSEWSAPTGVSGNF